MVLKELIMISYVEAVAKLPISSEFKITLQ